MDFIYSRSLANSFSLTQLRQFENAISDNSSVPLLKAEKSELYHCEVSNMHIYYVVFEPFTCFILKVSESKFNADEIADLLLSELTNLIKFSPCEMQ